MSGRKARANSSGQADPRYGDQRPIEALVMGLESRELQGVHAKE